MSFFERAQMVPYFPDHQAGEDWVRDGGFDFIEHKGVGTFEDILRDWTGGPTNSGIDVGPEMALRISAAYACRRVIAEDVAKLPRRLVRRFREAGVDHVEVMRDHPVHRLLTEAPNDWMTPFEFLEYMVGVSTFHRGAYAMVMRDAYTGQVTELLPLPPGSVSVEVDHKWDHVYRVNAYGENWLVQPQGMLRLHGPMADPWEGHATVQIAREAIGLAAAIEAAQARFHANDMRPSGVLTSEMEVTVEQREKLRQHWAAAYGAGGQGGVAVLGKSFKFEPIAIEGAKSEVLENRKFQVSETCRFFRVIPAMIGHNDGSQSYASLEAMHEAHKTNTLMPVVVRVEEAFTMGLLTPEERARGLRVDIDMDAILRGTPNERATYYEKALKSFMTPNEVRIREGLAPLPFPEMDRPQLQANNTGLNPSSAGGRLPAGQSPAPPKRQRFPWTR